MRKRSGMLIVAVALAPIPAGVALASSLGHRFAHGQDAGLNPTASAFGETKRPRTIYVRVTTDPIGVVIGGKYTTNCVKGHSGGTRGDEFTGKSPVTKRLRLRFSDPDVCDVGALVSAEQTGSIEVDLYSKKR